MDVKKLSDFEKYKDVKILVKFLREKFLQDLLDGKLFMNKLGTFIEMEEKGKKGQGDKYEAALITRITNGTVMLAGTDKVIGTLKTGEIIERYDNAKKVPIFCCTDMTGDNFEVVSENESSITVKVNVDKEQRDKLLIDFGDKAVVLPNDFIGRVGRKLEQQNLQLAFGNTIYVDNGIGDEMRKKAFDDGNHEMFFWKDDFFKYQQEYRLAVLGELVESHFILNIGELSEKPMVMNSVDFLDGNVTFEFPK